MRQNRLKADWVARRDFLRGSALILTGTLLGRTLPLMAQQPPDSAGRADPNLVEDLIAANRILYRQGIIFDGYGHVSVRHDRDPNRYLMSRSLAPGLVSSPDDIIEYDMESNPVDLRGRAQFTERPIHSEIYKARPDV